MRKSALNLLVLFSLLFLAFRLTSQPLSRVLGYQPRAGLKIASLPEAKVMVNGLEVGQTPYEDTNLLAGEYAVKLASDKGRWEGKVKLMRGTLSVVNRELGASIASSSGDVLVLSSGTGVVITSNPKEASVEVDGRIRGKTSLVLSDLASGEHTFLISRENFLKRQIRASIPAGMKLHLDVDLALVESNIEPFVTPSPQDIEVPKVTVKQTPTGFLRVRSQPSLKGVEVGKVFPGEVLVLLEELSEWSKVKLVDETEGYVSSSYIQKQ